jgi:inorganic triphosphatase YgiF
MAEEIELKLALAVAEQRRFLRIPLLREATEKSDELLDNTYFDTPGLELRKHGVALRVRRQGRRRLQTVKLAAQAMGALSIRPEWEIPYRGHFDFSCIELDDVRHWLQQPELLARIGPLFRTRFRRITWKLALPDGGSVLVALDRGAVLSGGQEELISEVELELYGSRDINALQELAARLGERVPLIPETLSKAQRGYNLLAAVTPASS